MTNRIDTRVVLEKGTSTEKIQPDRPVGKPMGLVITYAMKKAA